MRFLGEHDEAKASIAPVKIHHEPNLVNGPNSLKNGKDFVFKQVARDLADKDFAAFCRRVALVVGWRRAESSLAVFLNLKILENHFRSLNFCKTYDWVIDSCEQLKKTLLTGGTFYTLETAFDRCHFPNALHLLFNIIV